MPKTEAIKKVFVLGSGPVLIGQGAEFDYAGVEAIETLREEKVEVVLLNNNPATIMTDRKEGMRVYLEPLTFSYAKRIIEKEQPTAILLAFGGQLALNLAVELGRRGILKKERVKVLGTSLFSISEAENRLSFKKKMEKIGEPSLTSIGVSHIEMGMDFSKKVGFPLILREAFTLGGSGTFTIQNEDELFTLLQDVLAKSKDNSVLLEKSALGLKEIEYEVLRDARDNVLIVAEMENIDPVGIHTGDSMVVTPIKTLSHEQNDLLKRSAVKIVRALKIVGACNIQYAFDGKNSKYYVIEVNPRVSRSSALASKATGYAIAKMATKIALGYTLKEILPEASFKDKVSYLPNLNYTVVKLPIFSLEKFQGVEENLGTKMKATGEVMAVGKNFAEAFLKALLSVKGKTLLHQKNLRKVDQKVLEKKIRTFHYQHISLLAEIMYRNIFSLVTLAKMSGIDVWFLARFGEMVELEEQLLKEGPSVALVEAMRRYGYCATQIALLLGKNWHEVWKHYGFHVQYREVFAMGENHPASYFYSTVALEENAFPCKAKNTKAKILVLGSGAIRVGQGIEFDYASVHALKALKKMGYTSILVNNNPETLSTDYFVADKLYFEPLEAEHIVNICRREKVEGVFVSFGGQVALNLASALAKEGIKIFGTQEKDIMRAENRQIFAKLLQEAKIPLPKAISAGNFREAILGAKELSYPVIVRPSYVLGGRAMEIFYTEGEFVKYLHTKKDAFSAPMYVDSYLQGVEVEVDAIADGKDILILGILEEVEKAGVHSGDSISLYPVHNLTAEIISTIIAYTKSLALLLNIKGLFNIQFTVLQGKVYVLELNPRASRTLPLLTKITGVFLVEIATRTILGESLRTQGIIYDIVPIKPYFAVKMPIFSFSHLENAELLLSPEMKATGEVIGIDTRYERAIAKAFLGAGIDLYLVRGIFFHVGRREIEEAKKFMQLFADVDVKIFVSEKTAEVADKSALKLDMCRVVKTKENLLSLIREREINLVVNTFPKKENSLFIEYQIYKETKIHHALYVTVLATLSSVYDGILFVRQKGDISLFSLD